VANQLQAVPERLSQVDHGAERGVRVRLGEEPADDLGLGSNGSGQVGLGHLAGNPSFIESTNDPINGIDLLPALAIRLGERGRHHLLVEETVEAGLGTPRHRGSVTQKLRMASRWVLGDNYGSVVLLRVGLAACPRAPRTETFMTTTNKRTTKARSRTGARQVHPVAGDQPAGATEEGRAPVAAMTPLERQLEGERRFRAEAAKNGIIVESREVTADGDIVLMCSAHR